MGLLDWFKPKRDPPKKPKPKTAPSTTPTSTGASKLPKTTAKWKDRKTTTFADCLELASDIFKEASDS